MSSLRTLAIIMGIFSFLFGGCDRQKQNGPPKPRAQQPESARLDKPPEVTSESEEGFHDLVFYIQEHKCLDDGTQIIRASGVHDGQPVGFEVLLGPNWESGSLSKDIPLVTYRGVVTYRSVGVESDFFLQLLDALYGVRLKPKGMREETKFTGISLEGDPRDLSKGGVKIKLFYESEAEDRYAELYTNIDLDSRRLYFNEKDPDYRAPVIRALQEE
jgi:hypothetical protein